MPTVRIHPRRLPSFCHADRDLAAIDGIVVHYVSALNVAPAEKFSPRTVHALLCDLNRPADARDRYRFEPAERLYASYHYVIGRRGGVHELVPPPRVAYHAGVSEMHGRHGCNEFCVGIALIATHESGFTDSQYASLARLAGGLMRAHDFGPEWIQGHEHVARPVGRKPDPGPRFDWDRLHGELRAGAGAVPP